MWTLTRFAHLPGGTLGRLTRSGANRILYTVERPWKDNARYESCIPDDTYRLVTFSGRRWQDVLEVEDVPGRNYILFHPGNSPSDVQGCIAPGMDWTIDSRGNPKVLTSRKAMVELMDDARDYLAERGYVPFEIISQSCKIVLDN